MSVQQLVAAGRAAHNALLVDSCVIEHATQGAFNDTTGEYPLTWSTVYSGPCRVKGPSAGNVTVGAEQAGDAEQTVVRHTLVLPHGSATTAATGDRVTVSRVGSPSGVFLIVGAVDSTTMTARAFYIERLADGTAPTAGHVDAGIIDGGAP